MSAILPAALRAKLPALFAAGDNIATFPVKFLNSGHPEGTRAPYLLYHAWLTTEEKRYLDECVERFMAGVTNRPASHNHSTNYAADLVVMYELLQPHLTDVQDISLRGRLVEWGNWMSGTYLS